MSGFPECDSFNDHRRAICRGERLTPEQQDGYRALWGLPPIERSEVAAGSQRKPRGLGDTIAAFTHATGIDRVVKAVTKGKCGCARRQQVLNEIFPYGDAKQ